MSDIVIISIVQGLSVLPAAIAAIVGGWFSYKASEHSKEAAETAKTVAHNTDGLARALNELTAKSSKAEGVLEGKQEQKDHPA